MRQETTSKTTVKGKDRGTMDSDETMDMEDDSDTIQEQDQEDDEETGCDKEVDDDSFEEDLSVKRRSRRELSSAAKRKISSNT
jgi:hypothetical protein